MVAVKAAVTKIVSAQPGSAGSNPFSTVNVSPFLWCVDGPSEARAERAFPLFSRINAGFYDTWDREEADLGRRVARLAGPRTRLRCRIDLCGGAVEIDRARSARCIRATVALPPPRTARSVPLFLPSVFCTPKGRGFFRGAHAFLVQRAGGHSLFLEVLEILAKSCDVFSRRNAFSAFRRFFFFFTDDASPRASHAARDTPPPRRTPTLTRITTGKHGTS